MKYDFEYVLMQQKYRKENANRTNIFPKEWYFVKAYPLKKKILQECLSKHILIVNSDNYYEFKKCALS